VADIAGNFADTTAGAEADDRELVSWESDFTGESGPKLEDEERDRGLLLPRPNGRCESISGVKGGLGGSVTGSTLIHPNGSDTSRVFFRTAGLMSTFSDECGSIT
jgi:hypothetical protein